VTTPVPEDASQSGVLPEQDVGGVAVPPPVGTADVNPTPVGVESQHLQEQVWSGGIGYDPDIWLTPQGGGSLYFNRLTQATRELSPVQQDRALELAYLQYESNPVAKSVVGTTRDFVLGDSVTVTSIDPEESRRIEQQEVIDGFWTDPINLMDLKLPNKVMELGLYGEQCWPTQVNPVDGHVRLGYIDPASIKRVVVDPNNVEKVLAIATYYRSINAEDDEKWYRIVYLEDNPRRKWYGRLQGTYVDRQGKPISGGNDTISWTTLDGVTETHNVEGTCFFYTVNKVSNATRGRTDLLTIIDWIDAYDQLLFGEVDRGLLLKAFIWDVRLEGYNDSQIDAYKKANPQPRPASVRYHNEKVAWNAVTPSLNAADSKEAADLILSYISTGARLPKTWLNGMMDVNKATASELGVPALARLSLRQKIVRNMITQVITFVLDQAEMKGVIASRPKQKGSQSPREWPIHVALPDLKQANQIAVAQALNNIVAGVLAAMEGNLIDIELARGVVVMFIEQMGIDVNLEALRDRLNSNPPVTPVLPGAPGQNPTGLPSAAIRPGSNVARPRLRGMLSRMPANAPVNGATPTTMTNRTR
jgi:hypothetical protein